MATKKPMVKKNTKDASNHFTARNLSIAAILLIAISYLFILSEQTGAIGRVVRSAYFYLFGVFSYLIPLYVIALLGAVIINRFQGRVRTVLLQIGGLILLVMAVHSVYTPGLTAYGERIEQAKMLAVYPMGTGVTGAAMGWLLWRLLGRVGSTILLLLYFMVMLLLWLNLSVKDVGRTVYHALQRAYVQIQKMVRERQQEKPVRSVPEGPKRERRKPLEENEPQGTLAFVDYMEQEDAEVASYPTFSVLKGDTEKPKQMEIKELGAKHQEISTYEFPSIDLLESHSSASSPAEKKMILRKAEKIEQTLANFGIDAKVTQVNRGPTVTCFEMEPAPGVKVSRIVSLADDLALNLAAQDVRIVAPLPGKAAVGLEVPNETKDTVSLREIIDSPEFKNSQSKLPFALGKTITGKPIVSAIEKMPHLLIAGATGSGKSVCINTMIMSILYHARPDEVKLLLIDPKVVELSVYNGIPHLILPVVTQPKKASAAMFWAVEEMERRYQLFSKHRVRDITSYAQKMSVDTDMEKLPYIVIIIDELADLMMVAAGDVENYIARLAQMARACGIHLIVATQRPSVDVITGTIKANIPSRISFQVSSSIDSRTILDMSGAEKLLGKGDMLFNPAGFSKPLRIQGAFVTESEVERVVESLRVKDAAPLYDAEVIEMIEDHASPDAKELDDQDPLLIEAIDIVIQEGQAAVSLLQRKLRIGYARAGRLIDDMENLGIVGQHEGSKSRKVLIAFNPLKELKHESGQ